MNTKHNTIFLSFILCVVFVLVSVNDVKAQSSQSAGLRPTKMADRMEKRAETNVERLKNKTSKEIERRLKSLNNLLTLISTFNKISEEQQADLTAQVQEQITALTTLQSQLNAATDIVTVRTVKQSLVENYRIYALFIPKIHIMANAERLLTTVEKAKILADNLGKRIDEEKANGKYVPAAESLLISMRSRLAQAQKQAESAIDIVTPLTPERYPANKSELQRARELLRLGHRDLVLAQQDGRRILQAFGIGAKLTPMSSRTASVTAVPSL